MTPELSARAGGERLALVGSWHGLFRSLVGRARLNSGSVRILGQTPEAALEQGAIGVQRSTLNAPADFSVHQYLTESANLLGRGSQFSRTQVNAAIEQFGLGNHRRSLLTTLKALERRLVGLAQATLSNPRCLLCELPLHRFGESAQRLMLAAIERAAVGRKLIFSVADLTSAGPEYWLVSRADSILELKHGELTERHQLPPLIPARVWLLTVSGNPDGFAARLSAANIPCEPCGPVEALESLLIAGRNTDIRRFRIKPGDTPQADVFRASLEAAAPILELRPEA